MSSESLEASSGLTCEYHEQAFTPEQIWELIDALYANGIVASLGISECSEFEPDYKWQVTLEVTDGDSEPGNRAAYCQYSVFGAGETAFVALTDAIGNL